MMRGNAPIGHVGLDKTEHLLGGLGHLDEDTVVDLEQTEELQDFAGFGCNLVDTERPGELVIVIMNEHTHPRIRMTK